ncbi:palmitoyltransferase [Malassezia nana]|uniref:Palmitoyltransferase n=1 Tax=Malassezia nana TaxID=180528 RepID=A0AAF0J4G2_9BASI|nr:palmitoyltransferase [Malassezia nana]
MKLCAYELLTTVAVLIFANQPGQQAVPLLSAWDLNSFSWMQRGTVQDMMAFMAKTVSERTQPTQRQSIQENNFTAHVHVRPAVDGVSGVLVSDSEYPVRVAYSLLNKLLEEFLMKVPKSSWQAQAAQIAASGAIPSKGEGIIRTSEFPFAQDYLARYQDPRQADTILRVQQELDDTKIVLRGEDLDKLVEKSGSLSQQSKMFYKSARKPCRPRRMPPDLGARPPVSMRDMDTDMDTDTLFQQHGVREMEWYAVLLAHQAEEKQHAVRQLVGDSFDDLLRVSRAVVDMQAHIQGVQSTLQSMQHAASQDRASLPAPAPASSHAPSAPWTLITLAAAQLLLLDAPHLVRAALRNDTFVQAAWALVFAKQAHAFLTHEAAQAVAEPWADLQALAPAVRVRIDAQLQATSPRTASVLDALLAWMVLESVADPQRALTYWHTQQVLGAAHLGTSSEPLATRLERLVAHAAASWRHTERLWRRKGATTPLMATWHTLMRTDTSFFEQGCPSRALLSPAPLASAALYDALPPAVCALRMDTTSHDVDVDAALAHHMDCLGAAWDALPAQLAQTHDLDALLACRTALTRAAHNVTGTAPGVQALRAHMERVLDTRLHTLVQAMLARVTAAFGEALTAVWDDQDALGERSGRAVLWDAPERPASLRHARTARPPCIAACVRLMEDRFHSAVHTDVAAAPLQAACMTLAQFVADLAPATVTQQQSVLEVCAALYTSPVLQRMASPAFFEQVHAVHTRTAEAWAAAHAQRIAAQGRALQPSLVLLARTAHALAPSPLPAPPLLRCLTEAWPAASAADDAALAALAGPSDTWYPWRTALAPWVQNTHAPTAPRAPSARPGMVRVAPPFVV